MRRKRPLRQSCQFWLIPNIGYELLGPIAHHLLGEHHATADLEWLGIVLHSQASRTCSYQ